MSIYKRFRYTPARIEDRRNSGGRTGSGGFALSPRFDQPSYLSFRLVFGESDSYYNNAASADYVLNYDIMPHPLFESAGTDDVFERKKYSAVSYLRDSNEFTRAHMLNNFIDLWRKLQYNYQWYFQKIDGINELLKIDPVKGQRVTSDKRLTITTLEGVDLRMSHLMNLYRKIVWDDTYQRWVLPDMMRYFTMDIYISEFRTFHTPATYNGYGIAEGEGNATAGDLKLNILDDILPVWKVRCEMCEFDIQSVEYDHLSSLGVDEVPNESGVKFAIKVGKMYEEQIYPTFKNAFLIDKAINGLDRSKNEEVSAASRLNPVTGERETGAASTLPFDSTSADSDVNNNTSIHNNKLLLGIAQDQSYIESETQHISGTGFNEQANKKDIQRSNNQEGVPLSMATDGGEGDNRSKDGWFRNAATLGLSYLENRFEQVLDKSKITPIPGLGISFTEIQSALQGKNIITALGLLRKGVNDVVQQYGQPSELLEGQIYTDEAFRAYLEGVSKSEATSDLEVSLVEAANIALNDDGTWGKIKDFSLATDLTGPGETNQLNIIRSEGGILQSSTNSAATSGENQPTVTLNPPGESTLDNQLTNKLDRGDEDSAATSGNVQSAALTGEDSNINKKIASGNIIEGVPSSQATTNKLQN